MIISGKFESFRANKIFNHMSFSKASFDETILRIFDPIRDDHSITEYALGYLEYFIIYVLGDYAHSAWLAKQNKAREENKITLDDVIVAYNDSSHKVNDEALFSHFNVAISPNPPEDSLPEMSSELMKDLFIANYSFFSSAKIFVRLYLDHLIADERDRKNRVSIVHIGEAIEAH